MRQPDLEKCCGALGILGVMRRWSAEEKRTTLLLLSVSRGADFAELMHIADTIDEHTSLGELEAFHAHWKRYNVGAPKIIHVLDAEGVSRVLEKHAPLIASHVGNELRKHHKG